MSCSVVTRFVGRYQETGQYGRRPGQGRHRSTTPVQERFIRLNARRNRQMTARAMQIEFVRAEGHPIALQTIRNTVRLKPNSDFTIPNSWSLKLTNTEYSLWHYFASILELLANFCSNLSKLFI